MEDRDHSSESQALGGSAPSTPEAQGEDASHGAESFRPEQGGDHDVLLARLAAGLAHEIKNPLSTMAINLALLEEEWGRTGQSPAADGEPTAREKRCVKRVQTLQREVSRLAAIVDDFLRFARGGVIDRAPHDICTLVRELLDFVELEDARQGIRHHVELPVGLPLCMLDPGLFKQAVLNLLVNARQAMSAGGELIVRVQRRGNSVELSVTDTGVGMSPEDLRRCFDVYFSTKKGGTGLGLSTTRRIIEEHGGTIVVVSEVGRGTSFSIVLPLLVELHGANPVKPEDPGHRPESGSREREPEVEVRAAAPKARES